MLPLRVSAGINPKLTSLQGLPREWPFLLSLVPLGQHGRARSPSKPSQHPELEGTHEDHHTQLLATQRTTRKNQTLCLRALRKRSLNHKRLRVTATSPGSPPKEPFPSGTQPDPPVTRTFGWAIGELKAKTRLKHGA